VRDRRLRRRALLHPLRAAPLTLAEFTIGGGGNQDFYDISVIDGYNLAMAFSCSTGVGLVCRSSSCPDAYLFPNDNTKTARPMLAAAKATIRSHSAHDEAVGRTSSNLKQLSISPSIYHLIMY
jgi:hypothetical protein